MSWWGYVLAGTVVLLVLIAGWRLRPRAGVHSGSNYAAGKQLRKTYKDKTAPLAYDPTWLVEAARSQIPDRPDIIESLKKSTTIVGFCPCGCGQPYFIDPRSRDWDFEENVILQAGGKSVVLDVMGDGRVGSVEEY
jgi:hypothetical protein